VIGFGLSGGRSRAAARQALPDLLSLGNLGASAHSESMLAFRRTIRDGHSPRIRLGVGQLLCRIERLALLHPS
jgi:hypothetical protein